jgi:acyl phosphate:glycerol-3-phosphate acyltransferase
LPPWSVVIIGYLLGSIPFGYLIVRAAQGADVRERGSGGTGATNVSRSAGKTAGVMTLVLDAIKGMAAVLIAAITVETTVLGSARHAGSLNPEAFWWVAAAAIAVIAGHIFPVWLGFRGGKGVATFFGVFCILTPGLILPAAILFVLVVWGTRYVSLGSLIAVSSLPVLLILEHIFMGPLVSLPALLVTAVSGAGLIIFAHCANIGRLINGTESKFR